MAGKAVKRTKRWAVVTVYTRDDGYAPKVHVVETFGTSAAAIASAKRLAREYVKNYNDNVHWRKETSPTGMKFLYEPTTFDASWKKVDNKSKDWVFRDYGFDPTGPATDDAIRVVHWEE